MHVHNSLIDIHIHILTAICIDRHCHLAAFQLLNFHAAGGSHSQLPHSAATRRLKSWLAAEP